MVSLFGKIKDWVKFAFGYREVPPPFKEPQPPGPLPTEPEEEDFEEDEYARKYLGTEPYSDNFGKKNRMYYAVTYENNDTNREQELISAIKERYHLTHSPDFGYDDESLTTDIEGEPVYPQIEVGEI